MQFKTSHEAFESQEQTIVEIQGMVQTILVGEQGIEGGADPDQAAAGFIFAGQAVDLKAEDQADVAESNFRQKPEEIVPSGEGGAGATLIAVEDEDAFAGPSPGQGALSQLGLDRSGLGVAEDLLGA
jgi:hypothetical protein